MEQYQDNGLSGLSNIGNTCYLNSAIQCLSNTLSLTEYFLSNKFLEDLNNNKKEHFMSNEYHRLLSTMWEEPCIVRPISFKNMLGKYESRFNNMQQHDSHEVLTTLIDLLHTGLSYEVEINYKGDVKNELDEAEVESIKTWTNYFKKQYSKILEIFYGQYYSRLVCPNCREVSSNYDPFCTLTLPITNETENIYDCLDKMSDVELLDNDNQWRCDKCKEYGNALKKITLWKTPNNLIVTLKRFYNLRKNNKRIDFPLDDFNLENYVDGYDKYNSKYEAYAMINHIGGINSGHYYAFCKNTNGKWYKYDDSDVSEITSPDLDNVYVIFYRKKN